MKHILFICLVFLSVKVFAHPMPNSVVSLSVLKNNIEGEAKIPLVELESAVGLQADTSLNINNTFFKNYFLQHIHAGSKTQWTTHIESLTTIDEVDPVVGNYQQVIVHFQLLPTNSKDLRSFSFNYDAVVHQVLTHKVLVFVKEDWMNGVHNESKAEPIGVIQTDFNNGKQNVLAINLNEGSLWKGFESMVSLGMEHIKEGTDHLLFLVVLLLPATLVVKRKRWIDFGGTKYSIVSLLKIVTAFTLGHSVTLLLGASGVILLPANLVEVLIAVSILISAIHALYPIFPGKEFYVAAGFGLIHGMAFAAVLSNMNLGATTLALSILGFNLGIELMQLFIIALIIPWLILLSKTAYYKFLRIPVAILSAIAATAWIAQRTTSKANFITGFIDANTKYGVWCIVALAVIVLITYMLTNLINQITVLVAATNNESFDH